MSPRPAIFISAVSSELRSARQLVANTLTFLGYEPKWQDIFGTEGRDLRTMLRRRIDSCKGVVQLVGKCYGAEPPVIDERFGRVSYTQYEALYAASKSRKVWYLFLDETFPTDPHEAEDEEEQKLQSGYRARLKADVRLYHPLGSREGLEASVLKLRDDLTRLRRGVKRWAALVAALLVLIVALSVWLLHSQQHSNEQLQTLQEKVEKLQQGVISFAKVQNQMREEQPGQKPEEVEQRTYDELGKELGLDPATLREQLPRFAQQLKNAPNATTYDRANAAYVSKDYGEAEGLALAADDEAQAANPRRTGEAVKALELSGWAAEKRIEYADALKRLREAEKLTDRSRNLEEWAQVQSGIATVLYDQGHYRDAELVWREVLAEREHSLGPENTETLLVRRNLALMLSRQGKYADAEAEDRAILRLSEKALGAEHPNTLATRHNLAIVLYDQGKYVEVEVEERALISLEAKVLGPEHPKTLATRNNLGLALFQQGKFNEAEVEYREIINLEAKTLGPAHPNTLAMRLGLAIVLYNQGKYPEAEVEYRALTKLYEQVLGPEHPDTLRVRHSLANLLDDEGKFAEAEAEDRAVLRLREKVLGREHLDTLGTRANLALVLDHEGKYPEAESEYRSVISLEEKLRSPDHPDTLGTRSNLGNVLDEEGKHAEAEAEDRAVIALEEKALGPEHPQTLETRSNLGNALAHQHRYAEAESEFRAVLKLKEKALGLDHPDSLRTCFDLAVCLRAENELQEATTLARRAADGARKVLGPEHQDTKKYEQLLQELLAKEG